MRTRYTNLAVDQSEDRCLPSAPLPAPRPELLPIIEHRLALPTGPDLPRAIVWRDLSLDVARPAFFFDDTERLDHFRRDLDGRPPRADDGDESFIGWPAFVEPSPTDTSPIRTASPTVAPEAHRPASNVVAETVAAAASIVGDRTNVPRVAGTMPDPVASVREDAATPPIAESVPDAPPPGCPGGPAIAAGITQTVAVAVGPMAGQVAFGLSDLQEEVGRVLTTVSDLKAAWPDELPAWDETLWVGTALLIAGGVAYAAGARPAPRPPADPRAKVPARWPTTDER
jgi:hypothetical protein